MARTPTVAADGLALGYGSEPVLGGVRFEAGPGALVCVLGPNGGGKTNLFRVLVEDLRQLTVALTMTVSPD